MIIWLASYPKSGNTLLRSMLSAYFFSKEGIFNLDIIKNIKQFPNVTLFENLGIDIRNEEEVVKNYIRVQETFNKKNSVQFCKTHSCLFNYYNKYPFTNLEISLGAIYVVRDPRNVVTSYAKFSKDSVENVAEIMINKTYLSGDLNASKKKGERTTVLLGTWGSNYETWKSFTVDNKYLLIKYEDLITSPEEVFTKILKFIFKLNKKKLKIDKKKFDNVVRTTSFEYMKSLEIKDGFTESKIDPETNKKIPFFNLGPKNDWKKLLDPEITKKIEIAFKKEMEELGYL
ncbi:sulfotransferase domain-containing protein [Candidatus Pelagibacter bacterium nBUS_33]|jgi:hypothetical protein|uniref:sulfotransferase domain-containing protein n=1 Tax=Candidatus Pelagibacter bacterium nBUS_33 TaxID=3374193 RepID=UPI003EBC6DB8